MQFFIECDGQGLFNSFFPQLVLFPYKGTYIKKKHRGSIRIIFFFVLYFLQGYLKALNHLSLL